MKDSVNSLFQQRFQGHEMPVAPSVWAGIESQIGVPVADGVNDLFRDRFQGHEMAVDPAVWSGISSQLGHTAVMGTTVGTMLGWAAAGLVTVVLGTSVWLMSGSDEPLGSAIVQETRTTGPMGPVLEQNVQIAQAKEEVSKAGPTIGTTEGSVVGHSALPAPVRGTPEVFSSPAQPVQEQSPKPAVIPADPETDELTVEPVLTSPAEGVAIVESIIQGMTAEVQRVETESQESPLPAKKEEKGNFEEFVQSSTPDRTEAPLPKLYMPNTFTPNGDGLNDSYEVGGVKAYGQVIIHVTSLKTGQTVFSTNSGEPWYGNGCEDGMYLVALEAVAANGRSVTEGKVVWLNRSPMN